MGIMMLFINIFYPFITLFNANTYFGRQAGRRTGGFFFFFLPLTGIVIPHKNLTCTPPYALKMILL